VVNWLDRVLNEAHRKVASWPQWKRDLLRAQMRPRRWVAVGSSKADGPGSIPGGASTPPTELS
jgi:hypothetical protein